MTVDELRDLIADVVDERLVALTRHDPDEGLELREEFVAELQRRLASPGPTYTTEEVWERLS